MRTKNPFQVICIGENCKAHDICDSLCILKNKFKKYLKGCNYSKKNDCKYCSHKNQCILIKPYSEELKETELKRITLEIENEKLFEYISEWDEIERNLDKYQKKNKNVKSVTDVIYFPKDRNTKQKMFERITDNKRLIELYYKKEDGLIKNM